MNRRRASTLPAAVLAIILASPLHPVEAAPPSRLPHPPIAIQSDADFERPTSGVRSGKGTSADPYIIEGWSIVPGPSAVYLPDYGPPGIRTAGIFIGSTTAHVVIRNNFIHGNGGPAIQGVEAKNVTVESNDLGETRAYYAVVFVRSENVRVANNAISGSFAGFVASGSTITVEDNTISSCSTPNEYSMGMSIGADAVTIRRNFVAGCGTGINLSHGVGVVVESNEVTGGVWGIASTGCNQGRPEALRRAVIRQNIFVTANGGTLWCLSDFVLEDNRFTTTNIGLSMAVNRWVTGEPGAVRNNVIDAGEPKAHVRVPFAAEGYPFPYDVTWENNWANGNPILVFTGRQDEVLDGGGASAAFVAVVDGRNVTLRNWRIENCHVYTAQPPLQIVRGTDVVTENVDIDCPP